MRSHWPAVLLAASGLVLVLVYLGSDKLWEDEGDTAVLAENILKFGVPKAWDGVTFIDSDRGARLNKNLTMVSHPWLQYYLTAGSFSVFGRTAFAARLPFAFAGWLTILVSYALVWRVSRNKSASFAAGALLLLSVQFLLYSRQCRNYSLDMLLTCSAILIFFKLNSLRSAFLFAFTAILLFHSSPVGIVAIGVLGLLAFTYRPFASHRRYVLISAIPIALLTLPWLALARGGYSENTSLVVSVGDFFKRLGQYLIECASVAPIPGCVILLLLWLWISRRDNKREYRLEPSESALVVILACIFAGYALTMAFLEPCLTLWFLGPRYTPAIIPLVAMITGILLIKVARGRALIWAPCLLIIGLTKLGLITPWLFWDEHDVEAALQGKAREAVAHVPVRVIDRFFDAGQLAWLRSLGEPNPGTVSEIIDFLRLNATEGDIIVVNYSWEPLYFYTRLPQGLKILPNYPIYEAARQRGLPEYVFGVDGARWLIWRSAWDDYLGYRWNQVLQTVLERGGRLTDFGSLQETRWENRENIHFRRFAKGEYLYPWPKGPYPARVFRIDWP